MTIRDEIIRAIAAADDDLDTVNYEVYADAVMPFLEAKDAEIQRLRARIHEAVDECQRRYAPYQKRCDYFDKWATEAKKRYEEHCDKPWFYASQYARLFHMLLLQERDEARDESEKLRSLIRAAVDRIHAALTVCDTNDAHPWLIHIDVVRAALKGD